ncbi:hypothetical protein HMPREF2140_11065 [Hoylesella buccalis DNF00985]|nr:hypothetical protein HMPREF2140_11065 [Hoylesella buccalis DNF00985]
MLLTAAGLFRTFTRFPFHLIHSEPIAAAKIRLFTQEAELLYRKLQHKQGSNRWEKAVKPTALSLKGNVLNNECNKRNE